MASHGSKVATGAEISGPDADGAENDVSQELPHAAVTRKSIGNGRFVRFGWQGCSDLLGMMRDGRWLAVECKAAKGKLRAEQAEFLSLMRRCGGVAFVAHDCRDVLCELSTPDRMRHDDVTA
jgi:hypothetical protein